MRRPPRSGLRASGRKISAAADANQE